MSTTKKSNVVYLGILERFGYDLTVITNTEKECREKLMAKYLEAFEQENPGVNPKKELWDERYSDMTYYEAAKNDISIVEMEMGKVEWT